MGCTKPPFCVGDLNRLVTIQKKDKVDDGAGGQTATWSTRATAWCRIRPMNGREVMMYGQLNSTVVRVFETWYNSAVIPEDRIVYKDKAHNIHFIEDVGEKQRWMRVYAEEGVVS